MLHDYHRVHAAAGGAIAKTGTHYEKMLPVGFRQWTYRFALDRSHLDVHSNGFSPLRRSLAERIAVLERGDVPPQSIQGSFAGSTDNHESG